MDIAQFLIDNGLYRQEQKSVLEGILEAHRVHNTLTVIDDCAVARWNMDTQDVAYVIDVAIADKKRRSKYLIQLIKEGVRRFPTIKYLRFERGLKGKKMKLVNVSKFLKEK